MVNSRGTIMDGVITAVLFIYNVFQTKFSATSCTVDISHEVGFLNLAWL